MTTYLPSTARPPAGTIIHFWNRKTGQQWTERASG